jgi:hypothetical protein
MGNRLGGDFSKHILKVSDLGYDDGCKGFVHCLYTPNTEISKIIFTNLLAPIGKLIVTGAYGNWIFDRNFIPCKGFKISDSYWCEKLELNSVQKATIFDAEIAKEEINSFLQDNDDLSHDVVEWLTELYGSSDYGEYAYNGKAIQYPSDFEASDIPRGEKVNLRLGIIFDAFEEICSRL